MATTLSPYLPHAQHENKNAVQVISRNVFIDNTAKKTTQHKSEYTSALFKKH
ncbi:hypothetical protein [Dickeya zeae]|uniref:hypothetical protein n=1 Tax=Dickeya zeae TaxID=204042 RepID=UPI0012BB5EB9|nr:hypothetical protein [Dickeya zeae]UJR59253.1 hypothetical protein HJ580_14340 [Dickeya zeae]